MQQEAQIIERRVHLQQQQFKEYKKSETQRKIDKITAMWEYLASPEILLALSDNDGSEEQAIV